MNYTYNTIESMADGIKKDALISSGYKYRVSHWVGNETEAVAYYKTVSGARKRAERENRK